MAWQHAVDAHLRLDYSLCKEPVDVDDIQQHFLESEKHPKCTDGLIGFQDHGAYSEVCKKILLPNLH